MDHITRNELRGLAAREADACVSLYLPLHRTYPQTGDDAPRLAEQIDEAEELLLGPHGLEASFATKLLAPARELLEEKEFWQSSDAEGLAVLLTTADAMGPQLVTYRLPYEVPWSVDVGRRFHLTPLVPLLDASLDFRLVALALKHVRLYTCNRQAISAALLPAGVPESFEAYTAGTEVGRPIQFRSSTAGGTGGDQVGLVHGQTSYKDDHKMRVKEFVSHVGKLLHAAFKDNSAPLILAAVDYLHPVFRESCPLERLVAEGVNGSPDELSEREMHQQAVPLVEAWQERRIAKFNETYQTRLAHGHASHRLDVVVPAAEQGRVDTLVLGRNLRVWGEWDAIDQVASVHADRQSGDVDLLEMAVRATLLHGGAVHATAPETLIEGAPAAAILRW